MVDFNYFINNNCSYYPKQFLNIILINNTSFKFVHSQILIRSFEMFESVKRKYQYLEDREEDCYCRGDILILILYCPFGSTNRYKCHFVFVLNSVNKVTKMRWRLCVWRLVSPNGKHSLSSDFYETNNYRGAKTVSFYNYQQGGHASMWCIEPEILSPSNINSD